MVASDFETKSGGKTPEYAQAYLTGLLSQVRRKNMEGFAEAVPDVPWQNLQQFLSDSPWEWGPLWGWLGKEVSRDLGGGAENMLLIDESAFAKKGEKSVGVARQYSGRLGKVDNCQVGVFSCLSRGERAALIGARLYLPEEWTGDSERCTKAGVPEADQGFQTKNQLARELIAEASANGAEFGWVAFDAGYGREQHLLVELDAQGKCFMADVESDQLV
ncbi:MAG: IS701 family transposase [Verrucomicrobiota bacterium]